MPPLPAPSPGAASRARRWDAVVLGSSLPALVAAARIGAEGHRVLVVEEEASRRAHASLREPFLLFGGRGGVLDVCLRELGIPMIDRRRIEPEALACQVVTPERRVDVGEARLTAEEWVAWGLCKPDEARALVRGLREAARAEAAAMLAAPVVRLGRRVVAPRVAGPQVETAPPPAPRGLPADASPDGALGVHLDALVRALSHGAVAPPPPEARARLLGGTFEGGARFAGAPPWLHGLLRRRVEALYGEFRSLGGGFRLVASGGDAGVEVEGTSDLWVGRALVLGVPPASLARLWPEDARPSLLRHAVPGARRLRVLFAVDRDALPEGMAARVVLLANEARPPEGLGCIALARFPAHDAHCALVATAVLPPETDVAAAEDEIEARVRGLMPLAGDALARVSLRRPVWDDDGLLADPEPGAGWPGEVDLRLSARPRVYALDRAGVAGLGLEGDLLLGWRGGDAVAGELR